MDRAREMLRSGDWLTRERMRLVAAALLIASVAGFLYLVVTAHGLIDLQGRPLGTDFSNVYAAGTYVLDGDPRRRSTSLGSTPASRKSSAPRRRSTAGIIRRSFSSSPRALALMPYGVALAVWQAVTLGLYLLAIRAILPFVIPGRAKREPGIHNRQNSGTSAELHPRLSGYRFADSRRAASGMTSLWLLLALAFPAVLINVGHGQNGFLTAALLGGALVQLDRRPLLAGILFGLLAYKPQFGLMIPLVLAASGRWRCFAAAAATVALLALATTVAFGPQSGTRSSTRPASPASSRSNRATPAGTRFKACSPGRACGAQSIPLAYALQGALAVALGAALIWLWRGAAPYPLKAAALCLAAILATPYTFDYDMMVLAPAIAFSRRRRTRARVRPVGKDGACRALAGAARRAQRRTRDTRSPRGSGDARDVYSVVAAQHDAIHLADGFFRRIPTKIARRPWRRTARP